MHCHQSFTCIFKIVTKKDLKSLRFHKCVSEDHVIACESTQFKSFKHSTIDHILFIGGVEMCIIFETLICYFFAILYIEMYQRSLNSSSKGV